MPETRLFRLTWNTEGWEVPIAHSWKSENQGDRNIAYKNQYGFGHEEWLFNTRLFVDGYQYGYIRGASWLKAGNILVESAYLFTINQETGERYLAGEITDLEIIHLGSDLDATAQALVVPYLEDMEEELRQVSADASGLDNYRSSVRFRPDNCRLYDQLIPAPGLACRKYNRFIPYNVDEDLLQILQGAIPADVFQFSPGIASNKERMQRITPPRSQVIVRTHSNITRALARYFAADYSTARRNISIEKTRFGENIADVVLRHANNSFTIIEVKTGINQRRNIREAVGQLLDYALWHDNIRIRKLIAVAPTSLSAMEIAQFNRIRGRLSIPLHFWQYNENVENINGRFTEII